MKKIILILLVIVSCSKDDDPAVDETANYDFTGNWELVRISFEGNNKIGTGDITLYGATFPVEKLEDGYFRGYGTYPNDARSDLTITYHNTLKKWLYSPVDDTGVKTATPTSITYNGESKLVDSQGNEFTVNRTSSTEVQISLTSSELNLTYESEGYTITHKFRK